MTNLDYFDAVLAKTGDAVEWPFDLDEIREITAAVARVEALCRTAANPEPELGTLGSARASLAEAVLRALDGN